MSNPRESELPMLLVAAGAALDPQGTLRHAAEKAARARELL
jgi:hypothetical protein